MKTLLLFAICCFTLSLQAQTEKELIGKWKLVKMTKDGEEKDIKKEFKTDEVYQVFKEDHKFEGLNGDKSRSGKWSLSDDNKELKITISIVSVKFKIDYFDAKRRVITSGQTGTLEYNKVEE